MRRKLSRRKKVSYVIVGAGIATGLAAVLIWPLIQKLRLQSTIFVGKPTVKSASENIAALLE